MSAAAARATVGHIERAASGAVRALLPDGKRWHFQHGPIDLVIEAWGDAAECSRAYEQAWARFTTVLPELVAELPLLRAPINPRSLGDGDVKGAVARRMWRACAPLASIFITPMAAVAGAVADEILAAMTAGRRLRKAYVNNGGDIAIHLAPGLRFETGIVGEVSKPKITATADIAAEDGVRGIATSGWRGRSFSLGIADSATILACDAAAADAAATLVANAVNTDGAAVRRRPASALDPDSELGEHLVTVDVGRLDGAAIAAALANGERAAHSLRASGRIAAAYIELCGQRRAVGGEARSARLGPMPRTNPSNELPWSLRQ
ncbi:MAG: UPF0280 family protein [Alphaproteobacteria bacterium]